MLTEEKLLKEEREWEEKRDLLGRKATLEGEKRAFMESITPKLSTSKLLILFLFINCTLVQLFTAWVTVKSFYIVELTGAAPDFTPLVALIGAVVGEVIGFAVYALKSAKENTSGGIVFEQAMMESAIQETPEIFEDEEE